MGSILLCSGVALFIGYQMGWVYGYEKKDRDDQRIEGEMNAIWKGDKKAWATK